MGSRFFFVCYVTNGCCLGLNLSCSKVLATAKEQLLRLWHTTNIYLHPQIHEFAEKLVSKLPGNLKVSKSVHAVCIALVVECRFSSPLPSVLRCLQVVYFTNSGSEANDLAVTMARLHTGAFDVLALRLDLLICSSAWVLGLG